MKSSRKNFQCFEDWMDKYEHFNKFGQRTFPIIDEAKKQDNNLIKGCNLEFG